MTAFYEFYKRKNRGYAVIFGGFKANVKIFQTEKRVCEILKISDLCRHDGSG
jgi:hypothetical protein